MEMDKTKKEECSVSIIMPAFNEERYIKEALDSIFKGNSNYNDFEVLFVDDGSTDRTLPLVRKWYGDENRLHIFFGGGHGVSHARNLALEHAKGKYIVFCDADDRMAAGSLRALVERAEETDVDLVIGRMKIFGRYGSSTAQAADRLAETDSAIPTTHPLLYRTLMITAKLYRRQMILDHAIRFLPIAHSEDAAFYMECVFASRKIVGCCGKTGVKPPIIYEYRRRTFLETASVTQQMRLPLWEDFVTSNRHIESLIRENVPAKEQNAYLEGFRVRVCENIVREFWRYYWMCSPEMRKSIAETLEDYRGKMSREAWNAAVFAGPEDRYLGIPENQDAAVSPPYFTEEGRMHFGIAVLITPFIEKAEFELLIQSLYQQSFPSFCVCLKKEQLTYLAPQYADMENIFLYQEENGKINIMSRTEEKDSMQIQADFILRLCYPLGPYGNALTRMIRQLLERPELTAVFANVSSGKGLTFFNRLMNRARRYLPSAVLGNNRIPLLCRSKYHYADSVWRWQDTSEEPAGDGSFADDKACGKLTQSGKQEGCGKFAQNPMAVFLDILKV